MTDLYPRVYRLLVGHGHSPAKAIEIILEAMRGDELALEWIRFMRRLGR